MRRVMLMLLLIAAIALFSGCGDDKQTVTNEKGEILVYQGYEISENGFYIHNIKDDTFSPVFSGFSAYSGMPNDTDISANSNRGDAQIRHIWISDTEIDPDKFILEVDNKNTELVVWQSAEGDMPDGYFIEKYKRLGYTIGAYFTFGDTGNTLYINNKDHCKNSSAEDVLSRFSDGMLRVSRINKSTKLPLKNIDTEISMLLGLEKDKKYQIGLFDGTQYKDVDVIADTLCFKSQKITELRNPYKVTEDNYFVINLPENLSKGYYYINGGGMFKYSGKKKAAPKQPAEGASGSTENAEDNEDPVGTEKEQTNGDQEER